MHPDPRPPDWETHLIVRAQAGERVAFELLVDQHRPTLRAVALRLLRDVEDADDAVQDALLKAFRAIGTFQIGRPILPWLVRITTHCCVDVVRQRRLVTEPLERYEFFLPDRAEGVGTLAEAEITREAIRRAIEALPHEYRRIVHMRIYRHMDVGEIARELDKPEGTIKCWLFRARALLRRELGYATG